jgi:hypothetical protein
MAEPTCGASVQAVAIRVSILEQSGVPDPGAGHLYTSDALTKLEADPQYVAGVNIQKKNAGGSLCVNYKSRDVLSRYDTSLEICSLDPELENMLAGGELFTLGGVHVGGSTPQVGVVERPYGVSVELWSRHVGSGGDQDATWPWVWWVLPRSYWQPGKATWDENEMPRLFTGYTSENPNWFNGPLNDWAFSSDRSIAWCFSKTVPTPTCGAVALVGS